MTDNTLIDIRILATHEDGRKLAKKFTITITAPTAISSIRSDNDTEVSTTYYNIEGQRVDKAQHGTYIVVMLKSGKKRTANICETIKLHNTMKRLLSIVTCLLLVERQHMPSMCPTPSGRTCMRKYFTKGTVYSADNQRVRDCSTFTSPLATCFTMWARTARCMPTTTIA